jgi:hypothetical protein
MWLGGVGGAVDFMRGCNRWMHRGVATASRLIPSPAARLALKIWCIRRMLAAGGQLAGIHHCMSAGHKLSSPRWHTALGPAWSRVPVQRRSPYPPLSARGLLRSP